VNKTLGVICLCCCLLGFGGSATAVEGGSNTTKIAALVEKVMPPRKQYTPLPMLADKTCDITCGTAHYSATCTDDKECSCSCNSGCSCK
jgi:hypothetical protein